MTLLGALDEERHEVADVTDVPYPRYVVTLEQKRRWDVADDLAEAMFAYLHPGKGGHRSGAQSASSTVRIYPRMPHHSGA